jgi:D-aminopeptidase
VSATFFIGRRRFPIVKKTMSNRTLTVEFNEKKIDSIFAAANQCYLPGAAVDISIAGTPVYRKGFGLATIELPVLLSPSIRKRIHCETFAT